MEKKEQPKHQESKIIADDDWKAQAQAEKEKLAEELEKESPQAPADKEPSAARELPPASFATLVSSLVSQVFFSLGGLEDPKTRKRYVDLPLAKHHIDTLAMLEEKTKGNLSDDEKKILDRALYETRMQYVQIAQRFSQIG